jgi:hypothetical protein
MATRTGILSMSAVAALMWLLGYGMGGGFRFHRAGLARPGEGTDADRLRAAPEAGLRNRIARPADDSLDAQVAARRIPWTRERLANAVGAISREPDLVHAIRFAMKLTEQFGPEDFPLAIEVSPEIESAFDEEGEIYKAIALMRWAELRPEAAADYLKTNSNAGKGLISNSDMVLAVWGASNPTAALAWAKTLEKERQDGAIREILGALARRDANEAIAFAKANAPGLVTDGTLADAIDGTVRSRDPERNARTIAELGGANRMKSAVRAWAAKDPEAALQWAGELADDKLREEALRGVLTELTEKHPEQLEQHLAKVRADETSIRSASRSAVHALATRDPQMAAQWAGTLRDAVARREAFGGLGEHLGRTDLAAGGAWLDSLPEGTDRDGATRGWVTQAARRSPKEAAERATMIQDTGTRREVIGKTLSTWCSKDLAAALKWLRTSPNLSEEDRQAVQKKP